MGRVFAGFCAMVLVTIVGGGRADAQAVAPSQAAETAGPLAPPATIIVTGRRDHKPCEEKDKDCILAVAKQVWTHYPSQIEFYCGSARTHKGMERMLVDQLGLSSSYDSQSTDRAYDTLPPALAAVCNYKVEHTHQIAENWAPWTHVPTDADILAAFPRGAKVDSGDARINCKVEDNGRLEDCHLSDEEPEQAGFGPAAMHLAGKFHVNEVVARERREPAFWVDIAIHFSRTGAGSRVLAQPDWTLLPDSAATAALYPAQAAQAGVGSGVGKVDCRVAEDGRLDNCVLVGEEPAALGFGAAALAAAPQLRANLWTRDGQRAAGAHVVVPLRFETPVADTSKPSAGG